MTILLLLIVLQQEERIPRTQNEAYLAASKEYEKAVKEWETDPKGSIEILNRILDNPKIEKRECRLRIEWQPGTEIRRDFFPHQLRGRACQNSCLDPVSSPPYFTMRHSD